MASSTSMDHDPGRSRRGRRHARWRPGSGKRAWTPVTRVEWLRGPRVMRFHWGSFQQSHGARLVPGLFSQVGMGVDIGLPILLLWFALIYCGAALILWLVISIARDPAHRRCARPIPWAFRRFFAVAAAILWAVCCWDYLEQGAGSRRFRAVVPYAIVLTAAACGVAGSSAPPREGDAASEGTGRR
jgi:hypothetical protein